MMKSAQQPGMCHAGCAVPLFGSVTGQCVTYCSCHMVTAHLIPTHTGLMGYRGIASVCGADQRLVGHGVRSSRVTEVTANTFAEGLWEPMRLTGPVSLDVVTCWDVLDRTRV
jgi:hypothetical protein